MSGYLTTIDTLVLAGWALLHTVLVFKAGFLLGKGKVQYKNKVEKFDKMFRHPVDGVRTII